ncbi:hypothetical protein [Paraburkholderia sp. SIMBA_054]|uniref:hypothetical protein n=1 Tax=Paraburkholderia sp. SIMBA_054 TaxID=3085795 RepID=UPI00397AAD17
MSTTVQTPSYVNVHVEIGVSIFKYVVPDDSGFDRIVADLNADFQTLNGLIAEGLPADRLKEMAQRVRSAYGKLTRHIEQKLSRDSDSIRSAVETGAAIIASLESDEAQNLQIGHIARDALAKDIEAFFRKVAGRHINATFFWDLKFYEWSRSNGLVVRDERWARSSRPFSNEQLEEFFQANRPQVFKRMLTVEVANALMRLEDPIGSRDMENYYEAFRKVPSAMIDVTEGG